jgi:hypothetical protein
MEGLRKNTKDFGQDRFSGTELNPRPQNTKQK